MTQGLQEYKDTEHAAMGLRKPKPTWISIWAKMKGNKKGFQTHKVQEGDLKRGKYA